MLPVYQPIAIRQRRRELSSLDHLAVVAMLRLVQGGRLPWPSSYWQRWHSSALRGTAAGDALVHIVGLPLSTAVTGLVFAGRRLLHSREGQHGSKSHFASPRLGPISP